MKYQDILSQQNFVCAICKNPEKVKHNRKTISLLAVDHDHETGKIRGLLCSRCNQGLGHFDDNPEKLRSGIKYLEMFNRQY